MLLVAPSTTIVCSTVGLLATFLADNQRPGRIGVY